MVRVNSINGKSTIEAAMPEKIRRLYWRSTWLFTGAVVLILAPILMVAIELDKMHKDAARLLKR